MCVFVYSQLLYQWLAIVARIPGGIAAFSRLQRVEQQLAELREGLQIKEWRHVSTRWCPRSLAKLVIVSL